MIDDATKAAAAAGLAQYQRWRLLVARIEGLYPTEDDALIAQLLEVIPERPKRKAKRK